MISRRLAAIALSLGIAAAFVPAISVSAEDHLSEAIDYTRDALNVGRQGKANSLAEHAQIALQHAEAAEQEKDNVLTKAAIRDLKSAIEQAKAGKLDLAIELAELALGHLSHAK